MASRMKPFFQHHTPFGMGLKTCIGALAAMVAALLTAPAWAKAELRCRFEVNSETHHTVHGVASDPYTVAALPVGNRFRFKAILLGDPQNVESVNLYVYYNTRRQPMVMQHIQYLRPTPQSDPAADALTGRVALYSPLLGKELQYQCALAEVAP